MLAHIKISSCDVYKKIEKVSFHFSKFEPFKNTSILLYININLTNIILYYTIF